MRSFASRRVVPFADATEHQDRTPVLISTRSSDIRRVTTYLGLVAAGLCIVTSANAAPPVTRKPEKPGPTAPTTEAAPARQDATTPELMGVVPGGVTADQVAARAAATSYQAKAATETVHAYEARTAGAKVAYIPQIGLLARYARLSNFKPPAFTLGGGGFNSVVSSDPPTTVNPPNTLVSSPGGGGGIPLVLNQWTTQANITVPISDYFLKINQSVTAATHAEDAARFDVQTARAKSYSDGKIAYFTWLRARGALVVSEQSLAVARAHVKDSDNQFAVGNASKADVLRAQTQVAAAELQVERGKNAIAVAERQIRLATHAPEEEKFEPGESLDNPLPPAPQNVRSLVTEASGARPEIKSIDKNAVSARKLADVQNANKIPQLSAFGDVTYANPNQRRFPPRQTWFPTWQVGAQITWSPNDYFGAGPGAAEAEARANGLEAQKFATRDGIELEVTQQYHAVLEADVAIGTTTRQLESAEEAYRVARELFNAGRGTSTTLFDAEVALAQSRFEYLNAKVDARLARIRLDHAIGRDVK